MILSAYANDSADACLKTGVLEHAIIATPPPPLAPPWFLQKPFAQKTVFRWQCPVSKKKLFMQNRLEGCML